MKGKCFIALALLTTLVALPAQAQNRQAGEVFPESQPPGCLEDAFGYQWALNLQCQGCNCTVTGSVNIGAPPNWVVSGTINRCTGAANLTATNPDPDGCTFETDAFTYTGSFTPAGPRRYTGAGNWESFCGGTVLGAGTWSGNASLGPCPVRTVQPNGGPATIQNAAPGAVSSLETNPDGYALGASYPNPFTSATTISFALPEAQHVRISVYDVLGRQVATPVDEAREAGTHSVEFNAADLPGGTYVYRIQAGSYSEARQMMVVK